MSNKPKHTADNSQVEIAPSAVPTQTPAQFQAQQAALQPEATQDKTLEAKAKVDDVAKASTILSTMMPASADRNASLGENWSQKLITHIETSRTIDDFERMSIGDIRGLDQNAVAKRLIEAWAEQVLAGNIRYFTDHNYIAHLLTADHRTAYSVEKYLDRFNGPLDNDIAYAIGDELDGALKVIRYLEKFPKLNHSEFIDFMIGHSAEIASNDPAVLDKLNPDLQAKLRKRFPSLGVKW